MHDLAGFEGSDVPAVMVASVAFSDAAETQARALGTDPRRVFVPHPIQDRTDAEIQQLAEAAADKVVTALMRD